MAYTKSAAQEFNEALFAKLEDPSLTKEAADAVNDWTRTRIREDSITDRIQPPVTITADELDRQVHTDKPVKIVDKEPDIPPAMSVPYGGQPISFYIRAPKYAVTFCRILSPRFTKDIAELRTYTIDVRQVIADNAIKDLLAEKDTRYFQAWSTAFGGSADATSPMVGSATWQTIGGGIERATYKRSRQIMPSTKYRLEASLGVMNNLTVYEFEKWGRDEWGGDGSEDMLRNGWTMKKWDRLDWIITIKQDVVPTNSIFYFADPKFIGKQFLLQEPTMYVKREFWNLEWFIFCELGCTIGHAAGGARADF